MRIVDRLAEYITSENFASIPNPVIKKIKLHILDSIGNALFNGSRNTHKKFMSVMEDKGGDPEATIIGEDIKLPCTSTSFINAVLCGLYGGGHRRGYGHPSYSVIPTALAVGESENIDGKKFITSVVCGYEVFIRIAESVHPSCYKRGFQTTSIVGPFSAAAAAGKCLSFNRKKMGNSLKLAGLAGSGLVGALSTPGYSFQIAKVCESGVLSAFLAQKGLYGPDAIFEGELEEYSTGFCQVMTSNEARLEEITWGLNNTYETLNGYIKFHGGCKIGHASIDLITKMLSENNIEKDAIEKIEIKVSPRQEYVSRSLGHDTKPTTWKESVFSIPFEVSVAIVDGVPVGPEKFTEEKLQDEEIRKFMKKIKIEGEEGRKSSTSLGKIKTVDGKTYEDEIYFPKGEPERPLTENEVKSKFKRLASYRFESERVKKIINKIDELEKISDISELTEVL